MKENALLKLDYLSTLEIIGKGSFDLLQGQITADVNKVSDNNSVVGAMCDIKGRVISSFVVIKNFTKDSFAEFLFKLHKGLFCEVIIQKFHIDF